MKERSGVKAKRVREEFGQCRDRGAVDFPQVARLNSERYRRVTNCLTGGGRNKVSNTVNVQRSEREGLVKAGCVACRSPKQAKADSFSQLSYFSVGSLLCVPANTGARYFFLKQVEAVNLPSMFQPLLSVSRVAPDQSRARNHASGASRKRVLLPTSCRRFV